MSNNSSAQRLLSLHCRLCGGSLRTAFSLQVLGKYDVAYLACGECASLQTEPPYWLQEAYQTNLAKLDTGAAQRNLNNLAATYIVSRVLGLTNVLDFGGGDGLLCRLLRDYGINCFVADKYAAATYALAYTHPDFESPQLLLAFEVIEHFANPRTELKSLFAANPQALLASTSLYTGQGPDWWYLAPETGQHLFFYSLNALERVAQIHGYLLLSRGDYVLFVKPQHIRALQKLTVRLALSKVSMRLGSALLRLLPARGAARDFDSLRRRLK